jgi:hypothetical protein
MTEEERAKKLEEFSKKLAEFFSKEGQASGLQPPDGVLALMNVAADATVQVAAQCESPSSFVSWAIHTYFKSLKFFADHSDVKIGIVFNQAPIDEDDDEPEFDGGEIVH